MLSRAIPGLEQTSEPRTSRAYTHGACGWGTLAPGIQFERLSHPHTPVGGETWCSHCRAFVKLKDVAWTDTGESLSDYRARLGAAAPWSLKAVSWLLSPLVGALVVGLTVWLVAPLFGMRGFIAGNSGLTRNGLLALMCGALAPKFAVQFLPPWLSRRLCGLDCRRFV